MHKKTVKQLIRRIFRTVTAALLAALLMTGAPCTAIPAFAAADFYTGRAASGMPDFIALQAQNPDIYAWLYIPGTDINYPVCQSTNDVYYLTHNTQGGLDANGALYTESAYNGKGFTDPVTVIYGHNMRTGKMSATWKKPSAGDLTDPQKLSYTCRGIYRNIRYLPHFR